MDTTTIKKEYGITPAKLKRILAHKSVVNIKPLSLQLGSGKEYQFGAIGDTHLCSGKERLRELHTFYEICQRRGVKDVYNAGDIIAGMGVYPGQEFELNVFGADNQVNYAVQNYPKVEGITTYFIGGN